MPAIALQMTPAVVAKTIGSFILSVLGMYYLNLGQKEHAPGLMIRGAAMVLLSLFLFF